MRRSNIGQYSFSKPGNSTQFRSIEVMSPDESQLQLAASNSRPLGFIGRSTLAFDFLLPLGLIAYRAVNRDLGPFRGLDLAGLVLIMFTAICGSTRASRVGTWLCFRTFIYVLLLALVVGTIAFPDVTSRFFSPQIVAPVIPTAPVVTETASTDTTAEPATETPTTQPSPVEAVQQSPVSIANNLLQTQIQLAVCAFAILQSLVVCYIRRNRPSAGPEIRTGEALL